MPVVALLNQKGGVGKTSTCHHLAGTLALMGWRVLLLDNDPQSSLTQGFWGPTAARRLDPAETIAALYRGDDPYPEQVIRGAGMDGVDLIPGSRHANDFNVPRPFEAPYEQQTCIRSFLEPVRDAYSLVLIDCPPNLCLASWSALTAADYLVVPLQAEDYGAQGIMDVQDSAAMVQAGTNPGLRLAGYLITMFNARKTVHKIYAERLRELYGADVFETVVPHAADFPEAIAHRKPVALHKPRGASAKTMKALADELLVRIGSGGGVIPRNQPAAEEVIPGNQGTTGEAA